MSSGIKIDLLLTDEELDDISQYLVKVACMAISESGEPANDYASFQAYKPAIVKYIQDEFLLNIEPHWNKASVPSSQEQFDHQELLLYSYVWRAEERISKENEFPDESAQHDHCKKEIIKLLQQIEAQEATISSMKKRIHLFLGS